MSDPQPQPSRWQPPLFRGLLLVGLVLVFFWPAFQAGFVWDDGEAITNNPFNASFEGLRTMWASPKDIPHGHYWPLTYTAFWIQYQLWGAQPMGYHIVNVILHAVNVLLLWWLLKKLRLPGAWLSASLFAIHPMQAESVVWAIELKNILSGFFTLLTLHAYLRMNRLGGWKLTGLVIVLYACAMLSKTLAVTIPAVMVLLHLWKRLPFTIFSKAALAGCAAIAITLTVTHLLFFLPTQENLQLSLPDRLVVSGQCVWFYFIRLFWPHPLMTINPRWDVNWQAAWQWIPTLSVPVIYFALATFSKTRSLSAAWAYFVITLSPILNLVDPGYFAMHSFVNDHAVYYACIGLFVPVAALASGIISRLGKLGGAGIRLVAGGVLLVLGCLTWNQALLYKDMETLFRHAVYRNPESSLARYNLARVLLEHGEVEEAITHYQQAIRIRPTDSAAHLGLGSAYALQNKPEDAIREWEIALELEPRNIDAIQNLLLFSEKAGQVDKLLDYLERGLKLQPSNEMLLAKYAQTLYSTNQFQKSATQFERLLTLAPEHALARKGLAMSLANLKQDEKALPNLRKAVELFPRDGELLLQLARSESRQGNTTQALNIMQQVIEQQPGNSSTYFGAALLAKQLKQIPTTIGYYEKAVELRPQWTEALTQLSMLLSTTTDDTLRNGKRALELASRANEESTHPQVLEAVAAAYAETGQYDQAISKAEEALDNGSDLPENWVNEARRRLELYRSGQPLRQ